MQFTFEIPGEPAGKQRARSGNGHHYTPDKTVKYENLVKMAVWPIMAKRAPHAGPVSIQIWAYCGLPKSASKALVQRASAQKVPCLKKPDFDNVGKIVADAMNKIVYADDSQIYSASVQKYWANRPRVEVTVTLHD